MEETLPVFRGKGKHERRPPSPPSPHLIGCRPRRWPGCPQGQTEHFASAVCCGLAGGPVLREFEGIRQIPPEKHDSMKSRRAGLSVSSLIGILVVGCVTDRHSLNAIAAPATILIVNSGSTNTTGYRVNISSNGQATYSSGESWGHASLPRRMFDRFKRDIAAALPLSGLSATSCMKSASFGSSTHVAVGTDHSPDLSCAVSGAALPIQRDVGAIAEFLELRNVARGSAPDSSRQKSE